MFWTAVLFVPCALYVGIRAVQWYGWIWPSPLTWWLPDALAMPVILALGLLGTRLITRRPHLRLPVVMQVWTLGVVVVLFEWYLPQQSNVYTADGVDVGLYVCGTAYFTWAQRRWLPSIDRNSQVA